MANCPPPAPPPAPLTCGIPEVPWDSEWCAENAQRNSVNEVTAVPDNTGNARTLYGGASVGSPLIGNPTFDPTGMNGLPAVDFGGLKAFSALGTRPYFFSIPQPFTIAFIHQLKAPVPAGSVYVASPLNTPFVSGLMMEIFADDGLGTWTAQDAGGGFSISGAAAVGSTPHAVIAVADGVSSELYVDNVLVASGDLGVVGLAEAGFVAANSMGGFWAWGAILGRVPTPAERALVQTYAGRY